MKKRKAPAKVTVSGACYIDSSSNDLFFPVQYQVNSDAWEVFHDAEAFADAIEPLAKRSGSFKDHSELVQYISSVISPPRQKAGPTKKKIRSQALYDDFLQFG